MVWHRGLWEPNIHYPAPVLTPGSVGKSGPGAGVTRALTQMTLADLPEHLSSSSLSTRQRRP